MAVFTKLNKNEIDLLLNSYDIGELEEYSEIVEGIENTNYKIICNGNPYILTIFEKRVNEEDLPFFMNLKLYLNKNNFNCPKPIKNKNNQIINIIKNKKAVIVSFIEGSKIDSSNNDNCYEVGKIIGKLHHISQNFNQKKNNSLNILELKKILNKCIESNKKEFEEIFNIVKNEIKFIETSWPKELPSGIIHADLFKDNIFFNNGEITGVIDFYFSCFHFFIYDICIVINDWCFENNGKELNINFFDSIIQGYSNYRKLGKNEIDAFNVVLRVATIRILITRLHDYIFHSDDAIVVKKDPYQYLNILKWHQTNNLIPYK